MGGMDNLIVQASAVAIGGRALAIEGPPGSGKSSLALALVDRGATLIGDDAVSLSRRPAAGSSSEAILAGPPPNIAGLIEIRGVGIATVETASHVPLALILELPAPGDDLPPRLPETELWRTVLGIGIPVLAFEPGSIAPAARAEWALRLHGLADS
jgi:serine kinase of HPr protein (carbohydrate metabolism regulator)